LLLQVTDGGVTHTCFAGANYCTCEAYANAVLGHDAIFVCGVILAIAQHRSIAGWAVRDVSIASFPSPRQCPHLIAAHVSLAVGNVSTTEVSDAAFAELLAAVAHSA
jgi:hypothetical protein